MLVTALSACASQQRLSYVEPLSSQADAQAVADGVAAFLMTQFPAPATTTLVLEPTPASQGGNAVTPALVRALRQKGFAVSDRMAVTGAHTLRYWITPMDKAGDVVRLTVDGRTMASRFFAHDAGGKLQGDGPFTVLRMETAG
jgi:hypothetical protein